MGCHVNRLPNTSQHEADAESSGYMLFVNENFSRVRAELSQAAEDEESVASVAAAKQRSPRLQQHCQGEP